MHLEELRKVTKGDCSGGEMHSREGQTVLGRVGTAGPRLLLGADVAGSCRCLGPGAHVDSTSGRPAPSPVRCVCAWPVQSGSHTTPRTVSPARAGAAAPVGLRGRREGGPGTQRMLPVAQAPGRCHLTRSADRITGSRAANGLAKGTTSVVRRGPLPRLVLPASRVR